MHTTTVQPSGIPSPKTSVSAGWSDFAIGLALTALVPAFFWTAAFDMTANLIGYDPTPISLAIAGGAIAGFLGTFFAILTAKQH